MSSVKHLEIQSKAKEVLNVRKLWDIFINNCEATEGKSDIVPPPPVTSRTPCSGIAE